MTIEETGDRVVLTHPRDRTTSITVLKYGATLISWKLRGREQIWLSESSSLTKECGPVRGGIPLVFPQMNTNKDKLQVSDLPHHGFARVEQWQIVDRSETTLALQFANDKAENTSTLRWLSQYNFRLHVSFELSDSDLAVVASVDNTDAQEFEFNWLFHNYLRVDDVTKIRIQGLQGVKYHNNVTGEDIVESKKEITITDGVVGNVYQGVPEGTQIRIVVADKPVFDIINSSNLPDCVVWNPWKNAAGMEDFSPDSGYLNMVCVEPGFVSDYFKLSPGHTFRARQEIIGHI